MLLIPTPSAAVVLLPESGSGVCDCQAAVGVGVSSLKQQALVRKADLARASVCLTGSTVEHSDSGQDGNRGGVSPSPSSLDTTDISARKRRARLYQALRTGMDFPTKRTEKGLACEQLRMVTLTSTADSTGFQRDFRRLTGRLRRRGLLRDYIRVPENTKGGLRHEHVIFRGSYIDQAWLGRIWYQVHGAKIVDVRKVRGGRSLAGYLCKYLSKGLRLPRGEGSSKVSRWSCSWNWIFRGYRGAWKSLVSSWWHSDEPGGFKGLLTDWQNVCYAIASMRLKASTKGGEGW